MKQRLATYTAEVLFPEREKFAAPLLLLPGLWTGSWIWHEAAWGFSQRGWVCWALDLYTQQSRRQCGNTSLEDHLTTITAASAALDDPPIVIGFDLGSLLALLVTARIQPRALVCISPCCPVTGSRLCVPPFLWFDSQPYRRSSGIAPTLPRLVVLRATFFSMRFQQPCTTSYTPSLSQTQAKSSVPSPEARPIFRLPPCPVPAWLSGDGQTAWCLLQPCIGSQTLYKQLA